MIAEWFSPCEYKVAGALVLQKVDQHFLQSMVGGQCTGDYPRCGPYSLFSSDSSLQ